MTQGDNRNNNNNQADQYLLNQEPYNPEQNQHNVDPANPYQQQVVYDQAQVASPAAYEPMQYPQQEADQNVAQSQEGNYALAQPQPAPANQEDSFWEYNFAPGQSPDQPQSLMPSGLSKFEALQDENLENVLNLYENKTLSSFATVLKFIMILFVTTAVGFVLYFVVTSKNPWHEIDQKLQQYIALAMDSKLFKLSKDEKKEAETAEKILDEDLARDDEENSAIESATTAPAYEVPQNPYWTLPTKLSEDQPDHFNRVWNHWEEQMWYEGITNASVYKQFKTISEVRRERLRGSEVILFEGLKAKKFWTRMNSLMGLAEFGITLSLDLIEQTLVEVRPALIQNYFKRFYSQSTPGEREVMRWVLRIGDAPTRLAILQALSQSRDQLRNIYLVAASYDPDKGIKNWLQSFVEDHRISLVTRSAYSRFMSMKKPMMGMVSNDFLEPLTQGVDVTKSVDSNIEKETNDDEVGDVIEFYRPSRAINVNDSTDRVD